MGLLARIGSRDRRVARNILAGLVARAGALLLQLYGMRLMLQQVGGADLGVWLVLLSMLQWVTFCDLGIAYGARNTIAAAMARGDVGAARRAVSTAYAYALVVMLGLALVVAGLVISGAGAWWLQHVLSGRPQAGGILLMCLGAFLFNFVAGLVQQVYAALEKGAVLSLYSLLVNLLFVSALLWWPVAPTAGLFYVAAAYCAAMVIPNFLFTLTLYQSHPELRPVLAEVDHSLRRQFLGLGLPLFIVQLCGLVMFSSDRMIISALLSTHAVVVYDAAFKLFSVIGMAHSLMMGVLWSSFTHAHAEGDWVWIRLIVRRLLYLMVPLAGGAFLLALLAPTLVRWWMGEAMVGDNSLYAGFAAFTVVFCWTNIFTNFLNGVGAVRIQMMAFLAAAVANVPLSLYLCRTDLHEAGAIWSVATSLVLVGAATSWQVRNILMRESN